MAVKVAHGSHHLSLKAERLEKKQKTSKTWTDVAKPTVTPTGYARLLKVQRTNLQTPAVFIGLLDSASRFQVYTCLAMAKTSGARVTQHQGRVWDTGQ